MEGCSISSCDLKKERKKKTIMPDCVVSQYDGAEPPGGKIQVELIQDVWMQNF